MIKKPTTVNELSRHKPHSDRPDGYMRPEQTLQEQAAQLEYLMPRLARRLFTIERDHPAEELPLAQLRVCAILQNGSRTLSAISEELGISVSATTQIADRLEKAGLVERMAGQDDRRTKKLQLSIHGHEMMRTRRERRIERATKALTKLEPDLRSRAIEILQVLMEAVESVTLDKLPEDPIGVRQEQ